MTDLEDWDDILQKAGYDAGYKTATEEFLKKLKKIKEAVECKYGWNSVVYYINEYEERLKK